MGCKKGCGTDANLIELIVKDLIRGMINEGLLQEGLVSCDRNRLWRDTRVVTCEGAKDLICQLAEDGDLCFVTPQVVQVTDDGKVRIVMSDGTTITSATSVPDKHLNTVTLNAGVLRFADGKGVEIASVNLLDELRKLTVTVTMRGDDVVINRPGEPEIVIPKNRVAITKTPEGVVTFRNQDNSEVTINIKMDVEVTDAFGERLYYAKSTEQ